MGSEQALRHLFVRKLGIKVFANQGPVQIQAQNDAMQVLARHGVNVEELATHTSSAPMSAEILFHAQVSLLAGPGLDVRGLPEVRFAG